jgi:hypothetical protein
MARPLTQAARDRLREQVRREQDLAAGVLNAEARLAAEIAKRDAAIAAHNSAVAGRADAVADAVIDYLEQAGVGLERAAIVLGRPTPELARMVRERRQQRRATPRRHGGSGTRSAIPKIGGSPTVAAQPDR